MAQGLYRQGSAAHADAVYEARKTAAVIAGLGISMVYVGARGRQYQREHREHLRELDGLAKAPSRKSLDAYLGHVRSADEASHQRIIDRLRCKDDQLVATVGKELPAVQGYERSLLQGAGEIHALSWVFAFACVGVLAQNAYRLCRSRDAAARGADAPDT